MAGKLEPLAMEPPEVVEETEEAEGQTKPLKVPEDLLAMVKKLHKEGSLEPQIEDLINRINELQQAKKKSSEEMVEAQALWESLHRELDSLNGEKVHLEEVLSKKQEALGILQLHCERKESGAQRKNMLQECTEQTSVRNCQVTESCRQRKLGVQVEEQLENLMSQHKDLWELHMLKQRLTWEIRALQSSKEQLLTEEKLARDKLREVERRLRSPPEVGGARMVNDGRRRWRYSRGRRLPQTVAPQRTRPAKERPAPSAPAPAARTWSRPQTHRTRPAPSPHAPPSKATGNKGEDFGPSSTSSFSLFSNS
ncbi:synaptonemal complex central element protein 1-like isoform X1 [Panthera uncia]|uniref:synaptonemal complex central element protein 1-like isoform X1 n=2 Tax=Panthera uncia TaxID=29064 RepID=UPI0020FFE3AB|nr:synaptonemal complex central element protein 1-like isoform X1 [Panthera uncia]